VIPNPPRLRKFAKVSSNAISGRTVALPEDEQAFKNADAKLDQKNITKKDTGVDENSYPAPGPSAQNNELFPARLMPEMPHPGEYHRQPRLIRGSDDFVVAD
jgi:hypothetical protein